MRNVAYGLIAPARRRQLHGAVAATFEALDADTADLMSAQAATHYEQSGDERRALAAYQRAPAVAHRVHAYHDVILLARRGLTLIEGQAPGPGRDEAELALLEPLGVALYSGSGHDRDDETVYERARALRARRGQQPDPSTLR